MESHWTPHDATASSKSLGPITSFDDICPEQLEHDKKSGDFIWKQAT